MEGSVKDVAFGEKWSVVPRVAKEAKPSGMQMKEEMVLNVDGRPKGTPCVATSDFGEGSALFLSRKPMVFVGVLVLCYRHTDHQARVGSFFTLRLQVVFHTTTGTTAMVTCMCAALSPGMSRACTSTTPVCPRFHVFDVLVGFHASLGWPLLFHLHRLVGWWAWEWTGRV